MRISANQLHFCYLEGPAREAIPADVSAEFKKGYESFLDVYYPACLAQDLQNTQEDMSTYIDPSKVFEFIFEEVRQDQHIVIIDPKEFWAGYFQAQQTIEKLFYLAYTPEIEVA